MKGDRSPFTTPMKSQRQKTDNFHQTTAIYRIGSGWHFALCRVWPVPAGCLAVSIRGYGTIKEALDRSTLQQRAESRADLTKKFGADIAERYERVHTGRAQGDDVSVFRKIWMEGGKSPSSGKMSKKLEILAYAALWEGGYIPPPKGWE